MVRAHDVPVSFDNVRDKNLMQLTKLNLAIFPVKYDGRYYSDALSSGDFTKLGSKLMKHILDLCQRDSSIAEIYLHVQTNNEGALAFYQKFGFEVTGKVENYYTDIEPPDCYLLVKAVSPSAKQKGSVQVS